MKNENNILNQGLPYERFKRFGSEYLTEAELIAIILRTGTRDENALSLANKVLSLSRYPREGLLGLYELTLDDLMSVRGIGFVKAVKLKAIAELSMRMNSLRAKEGICMDNANSVAEYFMEKLRHRQTECVVLLSLDSKGQIIGEDRISDGSVRMSLISPREIFLNALERRAVNIILVHNHPSGNPAPSKSDIELTVNVRDIGEKIDIPLLDHIIIGDNKYSSLREMSYI